MMRIIYHLDFSGGGGGGGGVGGGGITSKYTSITNVITTF